MGEKRVIEQVASNEVHNDDWFLKDSPTQDTSKISATNLKAILGADGTQALSKEDNAIAEDYDSTSTYNKDDFAFYENKLYRCLANNTTGTWDGTKWEEFDLPTALITTAHNIETAEFTIGTYYSADDLVLKDGKLYQCVVGHNATEWKSQFWRSVTIDEMFEYISNSIALEHNQSTVYAVGDLVMHNKALWRCIQAGAGAFVNANWELVTVADLIAEAGKIDDVQVKTTGDYETVVENKIAKIDLSSVTAYGEVSNLPQAIATFKDGADAPMKSLKVAIEPQQEGSGDPSPENVRPISGWDEVDVTRTGKNLFDATNLINDRTIDTNGDLSGYGGRVATPNYIPVKPNTSICLSYSKTVSQNVVFIYALYKDGTLISRVANNPMGTAIQTENANQIRFAFYDSVSASDLYNIQLEYGNTATSYEPYNPNSETITIQLGDTYYGGKLDVVSGVLTVDRASVTVDENSNVISGSGGLPFRIDLLTEAKTSSSASALTGVKCNFLKEVTQSSSWGVDGTFSRVTTDAKIVYFKVNSEITTIQQLKTFLQSNNLQFVYELATPLTIQLTPTAVKSLLGSNNVWADTGDINECVYRRDMTSTIDDIIARLEALEG